MRMIYLLVLYLLLPFLILRLLWKSWGFPLYRARMLERFSLNDHKKQTVDVWLHAVSLGEVVAATPLIEQCLEQGSRVLVTSMTPTGSTQIIKQFGDRVLHQYIPYDYPWCLKRFFKAYQPRIGIIMETELWPNLITAATAAGVSLFLTNARISTRAFRQYQWIKRFLKPFLNQFKFVFAQSSLDASRFIALGAQPDHVKMYGNMKFDLLINPPKNDLLLNLKETWGGARPVVMAASTHEGEENDILKSFHRLQTLMPGVLLLIAPRHPQRFESVVKLSTAHGYITAQRTCLDQLNEATEVFIIDSLGELLTFYALSDYAFVGGSFVPVGGHNVLEPIALGLPVFCGPFMQNSQAVCDGLKEAGGLRQVSDADAWVDELFLLHQNPAIKYAQIEHAGAMLKANQGVVSRTLSDINR